MAAASSLVLHKGARIVDFDELSAVKAPPPEGRWFPLAHAQVLGRVRQTLSDAGYAVEKEQFALSRENNRFFGVMDLKSRLATGVSLAVGVRNSIDKSFPIGFCAGNRVFCCDNLAFRSELLVKRKHTRFGEQRFQADIAGAVTQLQSFQEAERHRINAMLNRELSDDEADGAILRAFEKGIVSTPFLPQVIREWRNPSFDEFRPRTVFSLLNAFTTALGDRAKRAPQEFAVQTMRLNAHLERFLPELTQLPGEVPDGLPAA